MKRLLTYLLVVPLLALMACEPRTDDDLMTDQDTLATQDDTRMHRAELQGWLDEVDRNLEQLQARVQETGDAEDVDIEDLRERRDEIRSELQDGAAESANWTADMGQDVQGRLRDLDADVEEARLKSIDQRDEFITEVRTRMNEIDSEIESLGRRANTGSMDGTTDENVATQPGTEDDAMADGTLDRSTEGADNYANDGTARLDGTTSGYAGRADVEGLREDREEIQEQLTELEADADAEFESMRDNLAESVADLHARVQEASIESRAHDTQMQTPTTTPGTASMN